MGLGAYLTLAAMLFCIGLFGVMTRRNTIGILLGIELMLNGVNINLVAFARFLGDVSGMVFTVFTICITVAEVALGLALVILIFRFRRPSLHLPSPFRVPADGDRPRPHLLPAFRLRGAGGVLSLPLIGYWYPRPEAARAAVKAFWITKAGDVFFLIGIVMLWSRTG